MASKKQLEALKRIIASAQNRENILAERARKSGIENTQARSCGVQRTSDGHFLVTDGFIAVYYDEEIEGLPADEASEPGTISRMLQAQMEGDYSMVTAPFDGHVRLSQIRKQLRENCTTVDAAGSDADRSEIVLLHTTLADGREISSGFDARNVRLAVEAVGGEPVLYIGYGRYRGNTRQSRPFLLIEQDGSDLDLGHGIHALVMPVRTKN